MINTDETLLDRVREHDAHDAWKLFYQGYWSAILAYARKLGLNQHQAEEVLQETMVTLMRILPEFRYDPEKGRFRNFLLTIVHRKCLAVLRRSRRQDDTSVPWSESGSHASHDPFDNDGASEREALARWRESLLESVLEELARDPRQGPRTLAIFRAYAVEGRSAPAVAEEFGLKENAVYQIKNRLSRRVQERLERRLRDADNAPA